MHVVTLSHWLCLLILLSLVKSKGKFLTAKQSVFLRIQVRASSQTKKKKRSGTRLKTEIEESRACAARTKLRHALPITDFEKETDCFAV